MMKANTAECVRQVANWSHIYPDHKFDKASFSRAKVKRDLPVASPKLAALFETIESLDAKDMAQDKKKYKHMIFSDVKSMGYGAKIIMSAFMAKGYVAAYDASFQLSEPELSKTRSNNVALLCSSVVYDKPVGVRFQRRILELFNRRPENIHGEYIRFIILDQGFKEGIDLFDVKYIHLFEPLLTAADEKQAIGRATRFCGQKGLRFHPSLGWPIHVFKYEVDLPEAWQKWSGVDAMFPLYIKYSDIDLKQLKIAKQLDELICSTAVDAELTRNIHNFDIRHHSPLASSPVPLDDHKKKKQKQNKKNKMVLRPKVVTKQKTFQDMRRFISERYGKFEWPEATLENQCDDKTKKEDKMGGSATILDFTPTQNFVRHYFQPNSAYKGILLAHSVGTGKCHAKDTGLLMYDGTIKRVQDVQVGDLLMGDDSKPRRVLSLASGTDMMYDVIPSDGHTYTVNSEHILCLRHEDAPYHLMEVPLKDFIQLPEREKEKWKGYHVPVDFPSADVDADPYMHGHSMGMEVMNMPFVATAEKAVPPQFKVNSRYVRMSFLAGFIDAIGVGRDGTYEIVVPARRLLGDLEFIARTLGYYTFSKDETSFFVLEIYGQGIEHIPVRKSAKKTHNPYAYSHYLLKDLNIQRVGMGVYYGFTLDGNQRYLLGDCMVTHNTCTSIATATTSWEPKGYTILWVTRHTLKRDIWKNMYQQVCSLVLQKKLKKNPHSLPDNAIETPMKHISDRWMQPISFKQFSNMCQAKNDIYRDLVKRNGAEDPLKKTLIILDEAHKLYAPDVTGSERPNVAAIKHAIQQSYERSGKDSVRVILMTATPYTADPMDFMRLINLLRKSDDQLPETIAAFEHKYLNGDGEFTDAGKKLFQDDVTGYVSYLNREKDARQFAYPVYHNVRVPMSLSSHEKIRQDLQSMQKEYADIKQKVQKGQDAKKKAQQKVQRDTEKRLAMCREQPVEQREACKQAVQTRMQQFEASLLQELTAKLSQDEPRVKEMHDQMQQWRTELKGPSDGSQELELKNRCFGKKAFV